ADTVVLAKLRDIVVTVRVLHRVTDVAQLAGLAAGCAADGAQELAIAVVDAQAVVVRVRDEEVAVAVDTEAAGPALAVVGGRPGGPQVLAIAVVDLDAGGEIDDVEAVLGVDGDGPGFDHIAVHDTAVTPDEFRFGGVAAACQGQQGHGEEG